MKRSSHRAVPLFLFSLKTSQTFFLFARALFFSTVFHTFAISSKYYGYEKICHRTVDAESITCLKPGYTGSNIIYDGGFIAIAAGEEIKATDIASNNGEQIAVAIDKEKKCITVTAGATGIVDAGFTTRATMIHDIAGRRVQEITAPGVYIVNGKKHIRK
ncbi:MAG: hypothetical protein J6Q73_03930 [Bacteroidaceae bacterium]|nr:hypothetical protein [Bacteroidaceae bacterium]